MSKPKQAAIIVNCWHSEENHEYLDFCGLCAPFWFKIPTCPNDNRKLNKTGYCKDCKKYYQIPK